MYYYCLLVFGQINGRPSRNNCRRTPDAFHYIKGLRVHKRQLIPSLIYDRLEGTLHFRIGITTDRPLHSELHVSNIKRSDILISQILIVRSY